MMSRIAVSSPPGVSSCSTTSGTSRFAASFSARTTYSAPAGPIAPSIRSTVTGAAAAAAEGPPATAAGAAASCAATPAIKPTERASPRSQGWALHLTPACYAACDAAGELFV